jgi:sialate O-acetylesterase
MYRAPAGEQDGPGQWTVVSPITVSGFSASAYFLARELYNKLKVPIGVVDSSNGVQCSALQTSAAPQFCLAQSSSLLAPFRQGIGVDMLVAAEAHVVVARLDVTDAAPAFSRVASLRRAWNAKSGNQFFF